MVDFRKEVGAGTLKKVAIIACVAIALVAAYAFYALYYVPYVESPQPITIINYKNNTIEFRADLREAAKVPVYPNDQDVYLDTVHQLVKNVTIVFKDAGPTQNAYVELETIELYYKMTLAYQTSFGSVDPQTGAVYPMVLPTFNVENVSSYENLPGKIQNPIIAIVPPMYANDTSVRNYGHVTYISGLTNEDLDLATVRFLMVELGISSDLSELS